MASGQPPTDILGNLGVPTTSTVTGTVDADQGTAQFDRTVDLHTEALAQSQVAEAYRLMLKANGWNVIYQGNAPQGAAGSTEVLAKKGSSDGFYWEIGVVVSPTTADGLHPVLDRGVRDPGRQLILVGAVPGRPVDGVGRVLGPAEHPGPQEQVDRVEQVAHPGGRGHQDGDQHHPAGHPGDGGGVPRRVPVEVAPEHGQAHHPHGDHVGPVDARHQGDEDVAGQRRWPPGTPPRPARAGTGPRCR